MTLAEKVRSRRLELGMTQEELATKMGYASRVSVNKIEMGRPVSQKIIVKLADALNVNPATLIGWEDEEPTPEDELDAKLVSVLQSLTPEEEKQVLHYASYLISQREG